MMSPLRFWASSAALLAGLLAVAVWLLLHWNMSNFTQQIADRLLLLAELRRGAVQEYFSTAEAELRFWSSNADLLDAQAELVSLWQAGDAAQQVQQSYIEDNPNPPGFYLNLDDAGDGTEYSALHSRLHEQARLFVTRRGYYDFFLIGPDGDIFYSVEKEPDFATNLVDGEWADSGLASAFREARQYRAARRIALSDMQAYEPSDGAPAIFMATAMHDSGGRFLGVIAFQLPTDRILGIMNYTSGMGETGETYLVGSDKLMRSDSRFSEQSTVLQQRVESPGVQRALDGEEGMLYVSDYRGIEVMSVFIPLDIGEHRWAVMAEIDRDEVELGAARNRPSIAGALAFVYGLSLWSVWYWRNRRLPGEGEQGGGLEFADGGEGSGLDG